VQSLPIDSAIENNELSQMLRSDAIQSLKDKNSIDNYNPARFSQKIDQKLIEISSNLFRINQDQQKIARISFFIQFREDINEKHRIEILNQLNPQIEINYNYRLIPVVSCSIPIVNIQNLFNEIDFIPEIVYLNSINQIKLEPNSILKTKLEDDSWTAPFSYENWWRDAIGMKDVNYTGKGVNLAIMDTGITVHPDFFTNGDSNKPRIVKSINFALEDGIVDPQYVFDDYGHGTHCAGIAGGNGYLSESKYQGVAPNVNLINVRALNSTGQADEDAIIKAIEWCVENGVNIISMSFGGGLPDSWSMESLAIQAAVRRGVIIVAAVGNSGPYFFTGGSPASNLYSIAVGATDINNHVVLFSSLGPSMTGQVLPDVCAPGRAIIATDAYGSIIHLENKYTNGFIGGNNLFKYIELSGTSMATPMVAGAVAVLLEAFPEATPEAIRIALVKGSEKMRTVSNAGETVAQGAGLINVSRSIEYLKEIKRSNYSVNNQSSSFPNVIPFAPYDFIRFPGDHQSFNLTLLSARNINISLDIPSIQGITITSNPTQYSFNSSDLTSIVVDIKINYDALPKTVLDYIKIIDTNTNKIMDIITLNFTIAYPKGLLYFDHFHGLTDYFPQRQTGINQMDMYHALYDLQRWNYSSSFKMELWTPEYNATTDAELISPQNLFGSDVLVLTSPRIMFSEFEIQTIVTFFNKGGSILFLGSNTNSMVSDSINGLFRRLGVGIAINGTELNKMYDFGYTTYQRWLEIEDIDLNSPLTQGISKFQFKTGCSFNIEGSASNISSINGNIVLASYDGNQEGKGRVVAIGSYQPFMDSNYNDPFKYGNHTLLWKNIINYLIPQETTKITINMDSRAENSTEIKMAVNYYNPEYQIPLNSSISGKLINSQFGNVTLIYNNITDGFYLNTTSIGFLNYSNKPWIIQVNIENQTKEKAFYYYPDSCNGYLNISTSITNLNRTSQNVEILIDKSENQVNNSYLGYFSLNPISSFGKNPSISQIIPINNSVGIFNPSNYNLSGLAWIFCEANCSINSKEYLDLKPDRYSYWILNNVPKITEKESNFANTSFSNTYSDSSISIFQIGLGVSFILEVFATDVEDSSSDLNVSCIFLQFLLYKGYINPIYSSKVPYYDLGFSANSQSFIGLIKTPQSLTWSVNGEFKEEIPESDFNTYFTVLWIIVTDKDGGSTDFFIVFALSSKINDNSNSYSPIIGLFVLLGICIIILQKGIKFNKKDQLICPNCGFIVDNLSQCQNCQFPLK
jgi:subtilisin family serine protease